ncbi:MAG: type 4a pilus biogenesis protein PilO [Gemmatimonadaceae bacterium]
MAGLPQTQRDQIMLVVGIVGLALAGAYWYFLYKPKEAELLVTRQRLERLDASNQRAKALLARGTTEELRAEAEVLQRNLDLMRTLIPAGNEVPALLEQIVGAARRTGMQIESFTPGAVAQGEIFDTYRYRMQIEGSYHQVGELLTAIGSLRRIISPVNLSLTLVQGERGRGPSVSASGTQLLAATFDIQTYVVKAAPPAGGAR